MENIRNKLAEVVMRVNILGMISCLVTVLVVTVNVAVRKFSGGSLVIQGSGELSAYLLVVICMLAIPALQVRNGHIRVEMLLNRLPRRHREIWLSTVYILEFLICVLFIAGGVSKLKLFWETGTRTDVLNVPKWPFALVCLLGFAELAALIGLDAILMIRGCLHGSPGTDAVGKQVKNRGL